MTKSEVNIKALRYLFKLLGDCNIIEINIENDIYPIPHFIVGEAVDGPDDYKFSGRRTVTLQLEEIK